MTETKAKRLAIRYMTKAALALAFNAALHDKYGDENPTSVNASKEKRRLIQAIEALGGKYEKHVTKKDT